MYVEVLLPVKLAWLPTYRSNLELHRGQRVQVKLSGRDYIGVVTETGVTPNCDPAKLQDIVGLAEGFPDISGKELEFWKFIADYYLCSLGEVYKAAYPGRTVKSEAVSARRRRKKPETEAGNTQREEVIFPTLRAGKPLLLESRNRTPFYLNAIRECLGEGRQALLLTPEHISGSSIAAALEAEFGDNFMVFDSSRTPSRLQAVTDAVRRNGPGLVMGTRSSVFLPFSDLGLVIVDEEQDCAYKQDSPAPRYNARDCAVVLAGIHGAKVLMGSSFPSLESRLNARSGKYDSIVRKDILPYTEIIDIVAERKKRGMNGNFSRKLLEAAGEVAGPLALIRGWENEEVLLEEISRLLPGREVRILTLAEARRENLRKYDLVAVMQIDALSLSPSDAALIGRRAAKRKQSSGEDPEKPDYSALRADFRTDEHLIQLMVTLSDRCRRLVVQTANPQRLSRTADELMEERRRFSFPPYTRIVDIRSRSGELVRRAFLKRDSNLAAKKLKLLSEIPDASIADVDPL